jgi:hypothetical protein
MCARKSTGNGKFYAAESELRQLWAENKQSAQVRRLVRVMEKIYISTKEDEKNHKGGWIPTVAGEPVCKTFFINYLGVNRSAVFSALQQLRDGGGDASKMQESRKLRHLYGKKTLALDQKREDIISLLKMFAKRFGDQMPDGVTRLPFKHHLNVYQHITTQFLKKYPHGSAEHITPPSYSYFLSIWAKHCSNIKLSREKGTHAMCTTCANFIAVLSKDVLSDEERELIKKKQDEHIKLQGLLRAKYRHHMNKAIFNKSKYLSIIIDGFDGRKSVVPYFKNCPKSVDAGRYNFKVSISSTYCYIILTLKTAMLSVYYIGDCSEGSRHRYLLLLPRRLSCWRQQCHDRVP